jgi:uncharacterized protein (TIGR00369 family)
MQPTESRPEWGEPASKTITWHDPLPTILSANERRLTGLEFLQAMGRGEYPFPPIGSLFSMRATEATHGEVRFAITPDASMLNPLATVHGGVVCTLLDSVAGCAAHSTLPAGHGYTSVEIKISYLRPVLLDGRDIHARGWVTKEGRRICFTDAEVTDADGRVLATASSSILVIPPAAG